MQQRKIKQRKMQDREGTMHRSATNTLWSFKQGSQGIIFDQILVSCTDNQMTDTQTYCHF